MPTIFYIASLVAVLATLAVVAGRNAVHSLLYLVVSLLAVAVIFAVLGAELAAAVQVIIYAGAIMVLFVFVIMMINPPVRSSHWLAVSPFGIIGPAVLAAVLLGLVTYMIFIVPPSSGRLLGGAHIDKQTTLVHGTQNQGNEGGPVAATQPTAGPKEVGMLMYQRYALGVELASILLLSAMVGAFHLGRRQIVEESK